MKIAVSRAPGAERVVTPLELFFDLVWEGVEWSDTRGRGGRMASRNVACRSDRR
jgi:hypothetical protein